MSQETETPPQERKGSGIEQSDDSQNWSVDQLTDEAANKPSDEIQREMSRGDESQGEPDDRDVAGGVESADTPQGREERKNDIEGNG